MAEGLALTPALLDERSRPSLRERLGSLLARAREADFAIARIRLDALDLSTTEMAGVRRCRVLVGRLDAHTLAGSGSVDPDEIERRFQALRDFLDTGRLEVRAAGLLTWNPDFSVLRGVADGPPADVALIGAHYFARPYDGDGLALTCIATDPRAIALATARFDELWERAYGVEEALRATLAGAGSNHGITPTR